LSITKDNVYNFCGAHNGEDVPLESILNFNFSVNEKLDEIIKGFKLWTFYSKQKKSTFQEIVEMNVHIIENEVHIDFLRVRCDKLTPNDSLTISKTIDSARSNISETNLIERIFY
jgi:hypothetical protein